MSNPAYKYYSYEEYLTLEEAADYKSEYYRGEIFALAGAAYPHNVVAVNIIGILFNTLRAYPCQVNNSDMRIRIEAVDFSTYADVMLVCG